MALFFFIIIVIVITSIFIIINSGIKLSINKFQVDTKNKKIYYDLKIGLYFMKKIPIVGIRINEKKIAKMKKTIKNMENSKILKKITKINIKKLSLNFEEKLKRKIKRKIKNNNIKPTEIANIIIKNLKIETLKFKMNLKIGLDDALITSIILAILSSIISIGLRLTVKDIKNSKNYYYKLMPIYGNGNILKLNLSCIINLKLVHIINIIYMVIKKGRSDRYVRASNRRSYGYCHE